VEREEFINVGAILFCRTQHHLAACIELDEARLRVLAPHLDLGELKQQLEIIPRLCAGEGPIGALGPAETFHWIVAPHSTVVQCSPVHSGLGSDLSQELDRIMDTAVRPQKTAGSGKS
jgi:hypothetical protein